MAYLLYKEGVSRKNIVMVVIISCFVIVSFPLTIAKLGTFIALLTYIVVILVMTRYLLGNQKEYSLQDKGTLVTGSELKELLVNMEKQGYEISFEQPANLVSLGNEEVINSIIEKQEEELSVAELTELLHEKSNVLMDMGSQDTAATQIIQEINENEFEKADSWPEYQSDDEKKENKLEEVEFPAEDVELRSSPEGIADEITAIELVDSEVLPEDTEEELDIADIACDTPEDIAVEILEEEESIAKAEDMAAAAIDINENKIETDGSEVRIVEKDNEPAPEMEEIQIADKTVELESENIEVIEKELAEAEESLSGDDLPEAAAEDEQILELPDSTTGILEAAHLDAVKAETEDTTESDDSEIIEEEVHELIPEITGMETIETGASEESGITKAEMTEAELEDLGLAEDAGLEREEQSQPSESEETQLADELVEIDDIEEETIEEMIAEAEETAVEDLPEVVAEDEQILELPDSTTGILEAAHLDAVKAETEDSTESDDSEVIEEEVHELIPEITEMETIETGAIEESDITKAEMTEAELEETGLAEESGLEMEEPVDMLGLDEKDNSVSEEKPIEKPIAESDEFAYAEISGENIAPAESVVEVQHLDAGETESAPKLIIKLIDQGFEYKEMSKWQEAIKCFEEADAITEDIELKELLNIELTNIMQFLK
ncbi:MAG: hypothetical protein PHC92_00040 [Syntrophomonadaceae bacterium]|nr:hypothetical protein [Syntrophomonadaceae bacterium]